MDVWQSFTGAVPGDRAWREVSQRAEVEQLRRCSRPELRSAAISVYQRGVDTPGERLPLDQWLNVCRSRQTKAPQESQLLGSARALRTVAARSDDDHARRVASLFGAPLASRALVLLEGRACEGIQDGPVLSPLRLKWRTPPSTSLVGAPVVDAPEDELAVVCLLALTHPQWQFSSTPQGWVFPTARNGWTRNESERDYVTGLSSILDTVAGVIEKHRMSRGGRVYVARGHVECADCPARDRVAQCSRVPGVRVRSMLQLHESTRVSPPFGLVAPRRVVSRPAGPGPYARKRVVNRARPVMGRLVDPSGGLIHTPVGESERCQVLLERRHLVRGQFVEG